MAKVVATQRGYFGGMIREGGDTFTVPDGLKSSWWVPAGSADAAEKPAAEPTKRKAKEKPELFADAPAPVHVANEINAATGADHPDWLAPGSDI